jgi:hypothetical protein
MRLHFLLLLLLSFSLSACISSRSSRGDNNDDDDDDSVALECGPPSDATDFGPDVGQILPDITIQWSDGNLGSLYELCGQVTLLHIDAMWNPIAELAAADMELLYQEFSSGGMTAATIMFANSSDEPEPPSASELDAWAEEFGLSFPVVGTLNSKESLSLIPNTAPSLPYFILVDHEMRVLRTQDLGIEEMVPLIEEALGS